MTYPAEANPVFQQYENSPIRIKGGTPLAGRVRIQGSKNATLPILAACLLISGTCVIHNCPNITDVTCMQKLLEYAGCKVIWQKDTITVDATGVREYRLPGSLVKKMRSSVILLGAMLGRLKEAGIDYPGGCVIGKRPIDLHLMALERLGSMIQIEGNYIHASALKLRGDKISFPFPSVGATQNAILASVLAEGKTIIHNAAKEPEIVALCEFLNMAGADIKGMESDTLVINGVKELHETEYSMVTDRIVAGTYLFGALSTGGEITLEEAPTTHMQAVLAIVEKMGGEIIYNNRQQSKSDITLRVPTYVQNLSYVETGVYPKFPTDLQSPLMATACKGLGSLILRERIFSNRFKIIEELQRMGADITCAEDCAVIRGGKELEGRNVIARELRGGAALVIAGLMAQGITTVSDTCYIARGYEDIVRDFTYLGAKMSWDLGNM